MATRQTLMAIAYPLKVIVSPFKAFKEIAQTPSMIGLVMLLALFLAATAASLYVSASKIILTIDGQPISLLASSMFSYFMLSSSVEATLVFFISWFVYAGVLFLLMRAFGQKGERWLPFFALIGYIFSVFIIRTVVTAVLVSTLPDLPTGISKWPPTTKEDITTYLDQFNAVWAPTLASQVVSILFWIVYGWFVMLGAVAIHASREITWGKAIMISLTTFLTVYVLSAFSPVPVMV